MTTLLILPDEQSTPPRRSLCRPGALHIPSLLVGIGLLVVLGVAFAFVAQAALRFEAPGQFDYQWAKRFKRVGDMHPDNTPWIRAVTYLGDRTVLAAVALCGAAWQFWRGRRWLAVAWIVIAVGGALLNEAVKAAAGRERPSPILRDPSVTENLTSKSFPSGHAMGAMVVYGLLGYTMILQSAKRRHIILTLVDLPIIVFAIGFSRVYLRVHWATDVLGGFLLGAVWLALSLGFLEAWRRGKGIPAAPTPLAS